MEIDFNALSAFEHTVKSRTLPDTDEFFKVNALVGELGEYSNLLKKQKIYDLIEDYKNRVDKEVESGERMSWRDKEIDELGDVFFYFIQLIQSRDISLDDIMVNQTVKLLDQDEKFGRKFIK